MHKSTKQAAYWQNSHLQSIVTVFKGINPTPTGNASLGELFDRMCANDCNEREKALKRANVCNLRKTAFEAKKSGDESGYKIEKELLRGFSSGELSYRSDAPDNFKTYVPIMVLDFDYSFFYEGDAPPWTPEFCREIFAKICADPYTLAAFFSPSGGLRVMVDAVSTLEIHRVTYGEVMEYFSLLTGLPILKSKKNSEGKKVANAPFGIDPTCQNESRFFYFVEGLTDDEFYLNGNSRLFIAGTPAKATKGEPAPNAPQTKPDAPQAQQTAPTLTDADAWEIYELMTDERHSTTANAGRNGRLFVLAQIAHDHGECENDILDYCRQFIEKDFTEAEIKATVASAVKRTSQKFDRTQLANYKAIREKPQKQPKHKNVDPGIEEKPSKYGAKNNYTEIVEYLEEHHEFKVDVVSNEIETRKKGTEKWEVLNENNILHELRKLGIKVSDAVLISLLGSDFVPKFDPFLTYFKGLKTYDPSEGDHIAKLAGYVKLKDEKERDFFNKMYRKMLVRVAAAATLRLAFNKQCFVFTGGQGGGKSTFVRFHCPPILSRYRVDWTREEVNEKDGRFALAQNLIINLDELASFGKHNIEQTKALMSLDHIKDRLPYGKRPVRFPRRASFFGSTNRDEFLTDETGTVRWQVFEISSIQHDHGGPTGYAANIEIDRVWAQAWHLLTSGEIVPELTEKEVEESEARNKAFAVSTYEMEMLLKHYQEAENEGIGVQFCLTGDIQNQIEKDTGIRLNRTNLGAAIKRLGWVQRTKRVKDKDHPVKGYFVCKLDMPGSAFEDIKNQEQMEEDTPF